MKIASDIGRTGRTILDLTAGNGTGPFPVRPNEASTVARLRERAWEDFKENGFDVRGREEWKYSDLKPVVQGGYRPCLDTLNRPTPSFQALDEKAWRLVFVNGLYDQDASRVEGLPDGVVFQSLTTESEAAEPVGMGDLAEYREAPFTAMNTAVWRDGLLFELPAEVTLDRPLELHFLTDTEAAGRLVAPRNLIRAGRGAQATVIEFFHGTAGSSVLNAPVTELVCEQDSEIRHWKVIREDDAGRHFGSTHVRQDAGSRYESREFSFGGATVRRELHIDLVGSGAHCDVTSLVMGSGDQRLDNRTRINHRASGCTTDELYKGIYADRSRGIFDGLIEVYRDAQQTAAHQTNRNLLLSDDAVVSSVPRLEIYADDVKCSHGSTTGQLDDEQLFFLRSRGFDASAARVMLAQAFGSEVVAGVDSAPLREILNREIADGLSEISELGEPR